MSVRRGDDHPNVRRSAALIDRNAKAQALDPALIKVVIAVESAIEPDAVSAKGALGLLKERHDGFRRGSDRNRGRRRDARRRSDQEQGVQKDRVHRR